MADNIEAAEAESDHNRVRISPQEEQRKMREKGLVLMVTSATHHLPVLHVHVIKERQG